MEEQLFVVSTRARLITFYLPQFHPIPENDEWWGRGFTEWTNVTKARPLFAGHYQPHLPADLGFYDLRLSDARIAQADLAREHLIEGFCYWHYWFHGKRVLERPFNEVLKHGQPDFPFCLAWANESWSRRWLGEDKDILLRQTYSAEDDLHHARWLAEAFSDPRYIQVQGRALFLIYRPLDLPEPQRTVEVIRQECVRNGLPDPYLLGINAHCLGKDCRTLGFDGTLDFEPKLGQLPLAFHDRASVFKFAHNLKRGVINPSLKIYDYTQARKRMLKFRHNFSVSPCIFVGWDNTPRRGANAIVLVNSTSEAFACGLNDMVNEAQSKPYEERLIFVNAWNEWAEGNHLEPDLKNGLGLLEAVKKTNSD